MPVLVVESTFRLASGDLVTPYAFAVIQAMGTSLGPLPENIDFGGQPVPVVIRTARVLQLKAYVVAYNALIAAEAVKNHAAGALNPDAQMRKTITLEQALAGKPIADPLNLYDCSLISDGAAAVILAPLERALEFTDKPVRVRGVAPASDYVALDQKPDITTFPAVRRAGEKAYQMAGVGPEDIEFAELHDCFTIAEIIATEDLGFVSKGCGGPYAMEGHTALTGERPINASGGLKSKGHPVGSTGVGQICDLVQQIRSEAGPRQVARHSLGLAQNLGGSGATCVVTILGEA